MRPPPIILLCYDFIALIVRLLRSHCSCGHRTIWWSVLLPAETLADKTELVLNYLLLDRSFSFVLTLFVLLQSAWIAKRLIRVLINLQISIFK